MPGRSRPGSGLHGLTGSARGEVVPDPTGHPGDAAPPPCQILDDREATVLLARAPADHDRANAVFLDSWLRRVGRPARPIVFPGGSL